MTDWAQVTVAFVGAGATFFGSLVAGVDVQSSAELAGVAFFTGMGGGAVHYLVNAQGGAAKASP